MTAAPPFFTPTDQLLGNDPVTIRRIVRWVECDPAGIAHTPRFLDYAISAYEAFLGYLVGGRLHSAKAAWGIDFPAKAVGLEFMTRITVDDIFDMRVAVGDIRTRTFDMIVKASRPAGDLVFTARLTPICFDPAAGLAIAIPAAIRQRLETYADKHPANPIGAVS